jgi:hypothetical protein
MAGQTYERVATPCASLREPATFIILPDDDPSRSAFVPESSVTVQRSDTRLRNRQHGPNT